MRRQRAERYTASDRARRSLRSASASRAWAGHLPLTVASSAHGQTEQARRIRSGIEEVELVVADVLVPLMAIEGVGRLEEHGRHAAEAER